MHLGIAFEVEDVQRALLASDALAGDERVAPVGGDDDAVRDFPTGGNPREFLSLLKIPDPYRTRALVAHWDLEKGRGADRRRTTPGRGEWRYLPAPG